MESTGAHPPQPSTTTAMSVAEAGVPTPPAAAKPAQEGPETVEQAPRSKRRREGAEPSAAQQQQQHQLNASLTAAQDDPQARQKRTRFSPRKQPASVCSADAGPRTGAGAGHAAAGHAAAAHAAAAVGSPRTRSRQHRRLHQEQQQHQQTMMSPPPPREPRHRLQQRQSPYRHATRAHQAAAAAAAAGAGVGGALTAAALSPSLSAMSELAAASSTVGAAADDEESEAICLRTRSKHPLAQADFDPDMFDRLLAEFDPDVEPLLDEEMYQQFLQTLQGDASYGAMMDFAPDAPGAAHTAAAAGAPSSAAAVPGQAPAAAARAPAASMTAAQQAAALAAPAAAGLAVLDSLPVAAMQNAGQPHIQHAQHNPHHHQQQGAFQAAPAGLFGATFNVDDEDDEEFQLDPLDWLLDDEADAAEEEALARMVEPSMECLSDATLPPLQEGTPVSSAAAVAALDTSRRRTQREAARRAAERIAAKQQQWMLAQQQAQQQQQVQQQQPLLQGGQLPVADAGGGAAFLQEQLQQAAALQPLIPATAAGDVQQQQQPQHVPWDPGAAAAAAAGHAAPAGGAGMAAAAAGWPSALQGAAGLLQQLPQHGNDTMQHLMQQQLLPVPGAIAGSWGNLQPGQAQQQQPQHQYVDAAHAAALPVPGVLTIRAEQLQQLYHQVSLHTQLLTQLYTMTALDPSPAAQAMASCAGQMLQQMKDLHALSTSSVRGQQLGQLVQHAFASQPPDPASSRSRTAGAASLRRSRLWRPTIRDMQTIWDTAPLRQLDKVLQKIQVVPAPQESMVQALMERAEADSGRARGSGPRQRPVVNNNSNSNPMTRVEGYLNRLVSSVLGECRPSFDATTWPLVAVPSRRSWTTAEDSLLWLGMVRFTGALTPLDVVTACISMQLLPTWSPAKIKKRFSNLIYRRAPMAERLLSYALIGGDVPSCWTAADRATAPGAAPGAAAAAGQQQLDRNKGPVWAATELGAALTAAFAVAEFGSSLPSTAAAAAASALLATGSAPAAAAGGGGEGADDDDGAADGQLHPPAALAAGLGLICDLVSEVVRKLPVMLPCAVEVPSAASLRRRSVVGLVAREAGQHMLMSLAARQILDAPGASAAAADAADADAGADSEDRQAGQEDDDVAAAAAAGDDAAADLSCDDALEVQQEQDGEAQEGDRQQDMDADGTGGFVAMMQDEEAAAAAAAAAPQTSGSARVNQQQAAGMEEEAAAKPDSCQQHGRRQQQPATQEQQGNQQQQQQDAGQQQASGSTQAPQQPVLAPAAAAAAAGQEAEQPDAAAAGSAACQADPAADHLDATLDKYLEQQVQQRTANGCASQKEHQHAQQQQEQQQELAQHPAHGTLPSQQQARRQQVQQQPQQQGTGQKRWWQLPKPQQQQQPVATAQAAGAAKQQPAAQQQSTHASSQGAAALAAAAADGSADQDLAGPTDMLVDILPAAQQQQQQEEEEGSQQPKNAKSPRQQPGVPATDHQQRQLKPRRQRRQQQQQKPAATTATTTAPRQQAQRAGAGLQQLRPRATTAAQIAEQLRSASRQHEARLKAEVARQKRLRREAARQQQQQRQSVSAKPPAKRPKQQQQEEAHDHNTLQEGYPQQHGSPVQQQQQAEKGILQASMSQQGQGNEEEEDEETCSEGEQQPLLRRRRQAKRGGDKAAAVGAPKPHSTAIAPPAAVSSPPPPAAVPDAAAATSSKGAAARGQGVSQPAAGVDTATVQLNAAAAAPLQGPVQSAPPRSPAEVTAAAAPAAAATAAVAAQPRVAAAPAAANVGGVAQSVAAAVQPCSAKGIPQLHQQSHGLDPARQKQGQSPGQIDPQQHTEQEQTEQEQTEQQQPEMQRRQPTPSQRQQQLVQSGPQASGVFGRRAKGSSALRVGFAAGANSMLLQPHSRLCSASIGGTAFSSPVQQQPPALPASAGRTQHTPRAAAVAAAATAGAGVGGLHSSLAAADLDGCAGVRMIGISSSMLTSPAQADVHHHAGGFAAVSAATGGARLIGGSQGVRRAAAAAAAPTAQGSGSQRPTQAPGSHNRLAAWARSNTPAGSAQGKGAAAVIAAAATLAAASSTPQNVHQATHADMPSAQRVSGTGQQQNVQEQWQQQLVWQRLLLWHQRQQQPDPVAAGSTLAAAAATPAVTPSSGWLVEIGSSEKKEKLRRSLFGRKAGAAAGGACGSGQHTSAARNTAGVAAADGPAAGGDGFAPSAGTGMPLQYEHRGVVASPGHQASATELDSSRPVEEQLIGQLKQQQEQLSQQQEQRHSATPRQAFEQYAAARVKKQAAGQVVPPVVNSRATAYQSGQEPQVLQPGALPNGVAPRGKAVTCHELLQTPVAAGPLPSRQEHDRHQQQQQLSQSRLAVAVMALGEQRSAVGKKQHGHGAGKQQPARQQQPANGVDDQLRWLAVQATTLDSPHPGLDVLASAAAAEAAGLNDGDV